MLSYLYIYTNTHTYKYMHRAAGWIGLSFDPIHSTVIWLPHAHVCIFESMYTCLCTYTNTHPHTNICAAHSCWTNGGIICLTAICIRVCRHTHAYIRMYIHIHTHTHTHVHSAWLLEELVHGFPTDMCVHTQVEAYVAMCIHTHTHKCTAQSCRMNRCVMIATATHMRGVGGATSSHGGVWGGVQHQVTTNGK